MDKNCSTRVVGYVLFAGVVAGLVASAALIPWLVDPAGHLPQLAVVGASLMSVLESALYACGSLMLVRATDDVGASRLLLGAGAIWVLRALLQLLVVAGRFGSTTPLGLPSSARAGVLLLLGTAAVVGFGAALLRSGLVARWIPWAMLTLQIVIAGVNVSREPFRSILARAAGVALPATSFAAEDASARRLVLVLTAAHVIIRSALSVSLVYRQKRRSAVMSVSA